MSNNSHHNLFWIVSGKSVAVYAQPPSFFCHDHLGMRLWTSYMACEKVNNLENRSNFLAVAVTLRGLHVKVSESSPVQKESLHGVA